MCVKSIENILSCIGQLIEENNVYLSYYCERQIIMTISFFSNFMNHHQLPLCLALSANCDVEFKFIATTPVPAERIDMGYYDMNSKWNFVIRAYENYETYQEAFRIVKESDVVIFGNAPEEYFDERIKKNKLTFRYSERLFKKGYLRLFSPKWFGKKCKKHIQVRKENVYMLCASAYTAADMSIIHAYKNRMLKWGYFPEVKQYNDIQTIIDGKENASILWVSRLISLKHPEAAIFVAKKLKMAGRKFHMNIIGSGELKNSLAETIKREGLDEYVSMLGSMSPDNVRKYMEKSQIFMFTSDRNEGWGAVMNESMNSGCAVVASNAIGSVPFLVNDGENGMIYRDGNMRQLYQKVEWLLLHDYEREKIGAMAYRTLVEKWNANQAAERFFKVSKALLNEQSAIGMYKSDVCSAAPIYSMRHYK